ncbi:hypothetical protein Tco_1242284 [Tanacetum coccineum]
MDETYYGDGGEEFSGAWLAFTPRVSCGFSPDYHFTYLPAADEIGVRSLCGRMAVSFLDVEYLSRFRVAFGCEVSGIESNLIDYRSKKLKGRSRVIRSLVSFLERIYRKLGKLSLNSVHTHPQKPSQNGSWDELFVLGGVCPTIIVGMLASRLAPFRALVWRQNVEHLFAGMKLGERLIEGGVYRDY